MQHREAAQVRLVEHALVPRQVEQLVVAPGEGGVDHPAFEHAARIVAGVEGEVLAPAADPVAEMGVAPMELADQLLGVGVEQQLVMIEAVARLRVVGAVDAIAVELARADVGQVAVPDLVGVLGQHDPLQLALAAGIEQAELDLLGIGAEQGEVDAPAIEGGAQRIGGTGPNPGTTRELEHGIVSCR